MEIKTVPRQHSSGGRPTLLGMSKRGDAYLRTLMIHGSRSVIYRAGQKNDPDSWLVELIKRRNINVAAMALANKTGQDRLGITNPQKRVPTGLPAFVDNCIDESSSFTEVDHTTDCTGNHLVMARQVKPGRHNPRRTRHLECVDAIKALTSRTHQGQRACPAVKRVASKNGI